MFEALPRASRRQTYEQSTLENQIAKDGIEARRKHAEDTGVLDGIVASNRQGLTGAIERAFQEAEFTPVLGWQLPEGIEKRWQEKGIRSEQWELLARAYSDEHLEWLEHLALKNQEDAYTLSEFGIIGNLALGLTDVAGLAIDVASGGIGYAAKAGRLGNMVRSGAVGAGASAVVMSSARQYNPEIELKDVVQASALSFALSGLLGARRGYLHTTPVHPDAVKRAAGWDEARTPKMEGMGAARVKRDYDNVNVIPRAGRLRNDTPVEDALLDEAYDNAHLQPRFSHLRIDLAARMGRSKSTFVRELGRRLFRDGVGYTDKDVAVAESTGEFAKRHLAVLETQWRRGLNEHWEAYRKENGIYFWNSGARKAFNMEVGRAVRGDADVSPAALKAARPVQESIRHAAKLAEESGLDGFTIDSPRTRANLKETSAAIKQEADAHALKEYRRKLDEAEQQSTLKSKLAAHAEQEAAKYREHARLAAKNTSVDQLRARATRMAKRAEKAERDSLKAFATHHDAYVKEELAEIERILNSTRSENRRGAVWDRVAALNKTARTARTRREKAKRALDAAGKEGSFAAFEKARQSYRKAQQQEAQAWQNAGLAAKAAEAADETTPALHAKNALARQSQQEKLADKLARSNELMERANKARQDAAHAREALHVVEKAEKLEQEAQTARQAAEAASQVQREAQQAYAQFNQSLTTPESPAIASLNPDHYLPRYWSESGFQRLFGEIGVREEDVIQNLLKPAMRRAWEASGRTLEIDEEVLDAVATAYIKRAQANFVGDGMSLLHKPLNLDDLTELGQMLKEAGVPESRSRDLLNKFERDMEDAGKLNRARSRIDLDENFTAVLKRYSKEFPYGEEIAIKVSDLFDNDVESVLTRYMREITGWSALAQKVGIRNRTELDTVINRAKVEARRAGEKDGGVERMLDIGINSTFGRSTEPDPASTASRVGRLIRNWNFSRVMNQVGFTMFAELGPVIAHSGLRNVLRSLPEIPGMLKRGRDGKLTSKEAQIMEDLFAPGTDLIRNPPFLRLDEDGSVALPTFEKAPWLDKWTHGANHITNILSGMAPITSILQRVAGRGTLLRMMELSRKAKLSDAEVQRLRTWGLDEAGQKQVFDYLKTIKKIEDINPQALPLETRERLSAFMYRATRHQVLEGDASDSIGLMHGVTGRIVLQFRTFMFNSYARHFLNSVHHYNDWATYQMLVLSTAFAGIGWASRAYLNTIGNQEQRERLLTTENFVKNGVAQSSWASFIPAATDFVWGDVLRNDPFFQGNRSTGLQNGVMGIPTMDLLNKAWSSTGMIGSLLDADEKITEEQMRDFSRIWWFSNMTGWRNIIDSAIDAGFPDKPDGTNRK